MVKFLDTIFGCFHRKTSFPQTKRGKKPITYVTCTDCGAHFAYDWKRMERGQRLEVKAETAEQRKVIPARRAVAQPIAINNGGKFRRGQ